MPMNTLTLKILFMVGFISAWAIRTPYQKRNNQNKRLVACLVLQERVLFVGKLIGI